MTEKRLESGEEIVHDDLGAGNLAECEVPDAELSWKTHYQQGD